MTDIIKNTRAIAPLVHCITNYVTACDCANAVLACGGSPIMADDENEAADITSICSALVINIGTLHAHTIGSMLSAGKRASELGHIMVFDPVGAGASRFRTKTAQRLMRELRFDVIRANMSEIRALAGFDTLSRGVDVSGEDAVTESNRDEAVRFLMEFSKRSGAVVAVTGAQDIITNGESVFIVKNGTPLMSKVTGTGCMLSAVCAAFAAANRERVFEAVTSAVAAMGLAGERAASYFRGTGSYRAGIIDEISNMTDEILAEGSRIEKR